jgi:hypothetical protein
MDDLMKKIDKLKKENKRLEEKTKKKKKKLESKDKDIKKLS